MKNIISDKYKTVVFHICLWGIWLYLPLSNTNEEELYNRAVFMISLITLTHIPFFFLNTEWLIPNFLHKKNTTAYFWMLILCMFIFGAWHSILGEWVRSAQGIVDKHPRNPVWSIIPIAFVAAISTGYGLFNYFVKEENLKLEKQQERLQSELSFLRSQISPHFIFNILN